MRRGEEPREAARRDLREELGPDVRPDGLVPAREMAVEWDCRRDRVRVFELRLRAEPVIRIDDREIAAARFVAAMLLAPDGLMPFVSAHLSGSHTRGWRPLA